MTIDKVIVSNLSNKDFSRFAGVAVDNELEFWTAEALIDELSLCLAKVKQIVTNKENDFRQLTIRKYYRQARDLMKWIPIAKPSPPFIIYISDLTPLRYLQ
jgi:hypothetical protein